MHVRYPLATPAVLSLDPLDHVMNPFDFSWMHGRRVSVALSEPATWVFSLGDACAVAVECPWRLIHHGRITMSSEDHLQMYGLKSAIDAGAKASSFIAGRVVTSVIVQAGTADLILGFGDSLRLEICPFSSGYESWSVSAPGSARVVAQGGGTLQLMRTV